MIRQPMLAAKASDAELQRLKWPRFGSPKIDGIRGTVVDGQLKSRSMKPIRNSHTQAKFGRPYFEGFDGELCVGNPWDKNLMQQTSSGVMSISGAPAVKFYIFDAWNIPGSYATRLDYISQMDRSDVDIIVVPHVLLIDYDHMLEFEAECLAMGYEGIMLNDPHGRYKDGRSTVRGGELIKVKRFTDDEATIVGYEPLMRNDNELERDERGYAKRSHSAAGKIADAMLGALVVVGAGSTVRFSIGSGFTAMQRYALWNRRDDLIGKVVKFKHFAVTGVKDVPRMPIFLGFRDKDDMS